MAGPLVVATLAFTGCSSGSTAADAGTDPAVVGTADASTELFDSSVVHSIAVAFDQADYDEMLAIYTDSGEKAWIEATVTIDGVTYERAGLRLKGNSSLAGLRSGRGGAGGIGGPGGTASADTPELLPWLIRLDKFVDGQEHQGYEDIVIRSNGSETSLNEAVALALLDEAGLASQRAMSTRFTVNGGDAVLRLAIEHPDDDEWQDRNFEEAGALYKAESTGDWSYRGDDPESYTDVFDQEGGKDVADLTPLIVFLKFLDESDDATFAAELQKRLDVDAFATYLAMMELVSNFDDIDGPGNNAYLWYDVSTERFTIVPWDMNLAFGRGGGGQGGFGQMPDGGRMGAPPEGFEPPAGGQMPVPGEATQAPEGGAQPRAGAQPPGGAFGGPGSFGRANVLVERFHANAELEALYEQKLAELTTSLYDSGTAAEILAAWTDTLIAGATDLVDDATITNEADVIAAMFTR